MRLSFKNGIKPNGAGYRLDKKIWRETQDKNLANGILERLRLFDRPVSADIIAQRLSGNLPDCVTTEDINRILDKLVESGDVVAEGSTYRIANKEVL